VASDRFLAGKNKVDSLRSGKRTDPGSLGYINQPQDSTVSIHSGLALTTRVICPRSGSSGIL
jgi:hypothetical protein